MGFKKTLTFLRSRRGKTFLYQLRIGLFEVEIYMDQSNPNFNNLNVSSREARNCAEALSVGNEIHKPSAY